MTTSPLNPSAPTPPRPEGLPPAVTVPRRFGMGIMLLAMTLFSLTFFVLRLLGLPGEAVTVICGFFVAISIAQMIWVRSPRKASIIAGMIYCYAVFLVSVAGEVWSYFVTPTPLPGSPASAMRNAMAVGICVAIPTLAPLGALFGYLGGGLMAGIFLLLGWEPNVEPAPDEIQSIAPADEDDAIQSPMA